MSSLPKPLHSALLLLALCLPLVGQIGPNNCSIGDDGFDVGCCIPVTQTNVPNFGSVLASGTYGCLLNCQLDREFPIRVRFDYQPALCDIATIAVSASPGTLAGPAVRGVLFAKYSRTFIETGAPGTPGVQVWRFLVNGDLFYANPTAASVPCPTPREALGANPVHFVGSIDAVRHRRPPRHPGSASP